MDFTFPITRNRVCPIPGDEAAGLRAFDGFVRSDASSATGGVPPLVVRPSGERRSAGLTLLEMLLVLAVLTAALAILYPATERLYRTHRSQQAIDQVRGKLAATRVRAIDDGLIYEVRYESQGRRLLVIAHGQAPFAHELDRRPETSAQGDPARWRFSGELPHGMRYGRQDEPDERVSPERLTGFPAAAELAATAWSAPVLFFPDGSATDAEIPVIDGDGHHLRIIVRGLTGTASIDRKSVAERN